MPRAALSASLVCLWSICAPPGATSRQAAGREQRRAPAAEVLELRRKIKEASLRGDAATLRALIAEDFTHTHAIGRVDGRERRIAAITSGSPTLESSEADDINVRIYGDAAVVTGRSTIKNLPADPTPVSHYRFTAVYVKRQGRWQVVASQATGIAQP